VRKLGRLRSSRHRWWLVLQYDLRLLWLLRRRRGSTRRRPGGPLRRWSLEHPGEFARLRRSGGRACAGRCNRSWGGRASNWRCNRRWSRRRLSEDAGKVATGLCRRSGGRRSLHGSPKHSCVLARRRCRLAGAAGEWAWSAGWRFREGPRSILDKGPGEIAGTRWRLWRAPRRGFRRDHRRRSTRLYRRLEHAGEFAWL
jgi:hypothetical protein